MITRFAPSPTGLLHLGHAFSALTAWDRAQAAGGRFLLRIEDIDGPRCRPEFEQAIYEDLDWLGIAWEEPVMRQSDRLPAYAAALDGLWARDLLYPCSCTRRDIAASASAPQEGAPLGPDGIVYPGTCRARPRKSSGPRPDGVALRLDMAEALDVLRTSSAPGAAVQFEETGAGPGGERGWIETDGDALGQEIGDVVLARKDIATSYHLAVVLDDAAQGVTEVVRGEDLFSATPIHVVLQRLLGLPTPSYHHHRLIRDTVGKRLAKRDDARAIRQFRTEGRSPEDIRAMVGL
ncbi:MAG: tRNA glutamyl-Q(34) synthetase GluQRS [Maritimibacter sp.]|nr:tRNA glutamyl-Q(34) synthetase GluQRS [Maritimibacter sp.]